MSEIDFVLCKNIQNQLFDLTTNNIMLAEAFLFNDVFSRDATVILFFYRTFCNCLIYRPNQTELYIKYLIDIYQKLNRLQRNTFNKIILGWSFHLPGPNIVHLFVLYRLFDLKLISLNEIIQSMRNFRFANNHIKLNLIYCLIWFAPEIKQKYEHFYQLLLGDLKDFKQNNPHNLLLIELDESSLFRNDFELLKQYRKQGHNHNSLMSIIINDDVLDLQNYIVQFKIDFNQVINPSIFEICPFIQNQPTLIELTAFFGSIKCFKYFLLNGADLESPRNPEENVFHFAIAGGNNEIIHICQQQKLFLIGGLQVAALFHRRSIMDWLIDDVLQNPKECTKTHGTMIQFAAISNHLEALELCFSLKVDVNDGGLNKTALQEACENGNLESVILLLTSKQINLNSCI